MLPESDRSFGSFYGSGNIFERTVVTVGKREQIRMNYNFITFSLVSDS